MVLENSFVLNRFVLCCWSFGRYVLYLPTFYIHTNLATLLLEATIIQMCQLAVNIQTYPIIYKLGHFIVQPKTLGHAWRYTDTSLRPCLQGDRMTLALWYDHLENAEFRFQYKPLDNDIGIGVRIFLEAIGGVPIIILFNYHC